MKPWSELHYPAPAVGAWLNALVSPMTLALWGEVACVVQLATAIALMFLSIELAREDARQARLREELRSLAAGRIVR